MSRDDVKKLLMVISVAYPNWQKKDTPLSVIIDIWTNLLDGYQYEDVSLALKMYIQTDTSGFAPSVGALTSACKKIRTEPSLTDTEAWGIVCRAMRNTTYSSESFDNLPADIKKAVGSYSTLRSWGMVNGDGLSYIQSSFCKAYNRIISEKETLSQMSPKLLSLIENRRRELGVSTGRLEAKNVQIEIQK